MKSLKEIQAMATRASLEQLLADDALRIGRAENPARAVKASVFAQGVEVALRWAGAGERTKDQLRHSGDRARTGQEAMKAIRGTGDIAADHLDAALTFSEGFEMGFRWAAGDTSDALPTDMFPIAITVIEYSDSDVDDTLNWLLSTD